MLSTNYPKSTLLVHSQNTKRLIIKGIVPDNNYFPDLIAVNSDGNLTS